MQKIFNVGYPDIKILQCLQIGKMVKKVFKNAPLIVLHKPSHL